MTVISKTAWVLAILNAITIFILSSITFPGRSGGGFNYLTTLYHFFAFFFLALFLLLAIVKGEKTRTRYIFLVMIIAILYGVSDEIHQLFVMGRSASIGDVITNTMGILTISGIYALFLKYKGL